jgi:hypothetical protein
VKILDNNNYIEATCPHCKSKLGIHQGDIRHNEISHRNSAFEATCAACGRIVPIQATSIPNSWVSSITGE